ncbi:exodeoxyribonuclease V subunit alpha [Endozoicomonas sp. (ex Bugula neritina AB1)]|nr:exodeoxyribonuclease V subunit alpha [Endozoicomonas sp. (ex Bugula neritina AB1)]
MLSLLKTLEQQRVIRPLDYQFARLMNELCPDSTLTLISALVSFELGQGNVCLHIQEINTDSLFGQDSIISRELMDKLEHPVDQWLTHIETLPVVSNGSRPAPLVYDLGRIYLYRYWDYEVNLTHYLNSNEVIPLDLSQAKEIIDRLFGKDEQLNWQKVAAALAASRSFSVISGGPGTGKTTTVTRLLALLVELGMKSQHIPEIKLVAPTGKAAARLTESIGGALEKLNCSDDVIDNIPTQAGTIHRLLGVIPNNVNFRHNRNNRLHLDILVVDEASMVDLPMMSRLLNALPDHARLILLGDRDQLASVEAGSVLGDICAAADFGYSSNQTKMLEQLTGFQLNENQSPHNQTAGDHLCMLRKSFRFHKHSGIGKLARAVNDGNSQGLKEVFHQGFDDIALHSSQGDEYQALIKLCVKGYRGYLEQIQQQASDEEILQAFNQFQLLCALRAGSFGVAGLNQEIRQALTKAGLISGDSQWYEGRPVLITKNDYGLGLYNGDIGIAVTGSDGRLRVLFELPDKTIKHLLPSRLPEHETVFAMTIHKSQGSEFNHTVMVLPDQTNPVVTRELVYTGITRAKKRLDLYADLAVLIRAINSPTLRTSGLKQRLGSP